MGVVNLLEAKSRMELREWLIFLFLGGIRLYLYSADFYGISIFEFWCESISFDHILKQALLDKQIIECHKNEREWTLPELNTTQFGPFSFFQQHSELEFTLQRFIFLYLSVLSLW